MLQSWLGTPYAAGQATKGRGVDCRYFAVRVLDELHGMLDVPLPPRLNPATSWVDPREAVRVARAIVGRWPCRHLAAGEPLEPGDVVVTKDHGFKRTDVPSHVLVVGPRLELWHAGKYDVCWTGLDAVRADVIHVWRPTCKETWKSSPSRPSSGT